MWFLPRISAFTSRKTWTPTDNPLPLMGVHVLPIGPIMKGDAMRKQIPKMVALLGSALFAVTLVQGGQHLNTHALSNSPAAAANTGYDLIGLPVPKARVVKPGCSRYHQQWHRFRLLQSPRVHECPHILFRKWGIHGPHRTGCDSHVHGCDKQREAVRKLG